jgi:hypothetical protein
MADELGPAVSALQRKLDEQLQAVADTKRTINMLLKMDGQEPLYADTEKETSGAVRADQFYGKGLATAAADYLAIRKQACQPDEILRGLAAGGFDFDMLGWKEDDRLRSLAISLAKNTGEMGKFHRLKNGTFGLRNWYDAEFLKRVAAGADGAQKTKRKTKKNKTVGKITKAETAEKQVEDAQQELCSRGCGNPRHRGFCKKTSSVKEKSHPATDQTAQKEVKAAM